MPRKLKEDLRLSGKDGNAFSILGRANAVLRKAGRGDEIDEFNKEAQSGDYQHLLATCGRWFNLS